METIAAPEDTIKDWIKLVSNPENWFEHENTDPVEDSEYKEEAEAQDAKIEAERDKDSGEYSGQGVMTFANGDYFEGEFLGLGTDRRGILTRLSESGGLTEGTWISGRMTGYCEVENVGLAEWSQAMYERGLKVISFAKSHLRTTSLYEYICRCITMHCTEKVIKANKVMFKLKFIKMFLLK